MSLFGENVELEKFVKKHHRGFVIIEAQREWNQVTGRWYIHMQLMRKKLWQRNMAICEAAEKSKIKEAEQLILPYMPEYKINGIQGVLW